MKINFKLIFIISVLLGNFSFTQTYFGNYTAHSSGGNSVKVFSDSTSVNLIFYKDDIVRFDFLPSPLTQIDSSFVVVQDTIESVSYLINDFPDKLEISTASVKISFNKFPLRFNVSNSAGKSLLSEPDEGGLSFNGNERTANFILGNDDHFYGTGERGTDLDKRVQSFTSYNSQVFGYSTPLETMNINVPFFANKKGYAVYFDNTYPGYFDFGETNSNKFLYRVSGGEMSFYFIAANTVQEQLQKYTWLTGRQPLPPKWAFGYIQSKFGYRNESEARSMVQTMRSKSIPCDAVILDLYWFNQMGDISWDFTDWQDPFQMMTDFLNTGIKTIVITEPYIVEYSTNFNQAISNGYFTFNNLGNPVMISNWWSCNCNAGLIDLSNPDARQWWWSKHPSFYGAQLAGIWTDLGEPENHPETMNHFLGSRDKVHNIYNFLWSQMIFDGISELRPNERVFNLTRSGFAGSQRFGIIPWSGDVSKTFGGLKVQIPMLLNMGMSGLAYHNSDIGGFCCGYTTQELYVRWMQYGTFCPVTRAHGQDYQPTEPWGYGEPAESISKNYIKLRYQLLPYIYTMAYENFLTGMPLARPLFFDYPEDEFLNNYSDAYLWGRSFLVAPVVEEGQTSKNVYLPEGKWIDFFSDQVYSGGTSYSISTPLVKMPVFVKGGSIIPMQPVMNYTDEFPLDTLIFAVYPELNVLASFNLYEDDGTTLDYQNGNFSLTEISQNISTSNDLIVNIGNAVGNFSGKLSNRIYLCDVHLMFRTPDLVFKNDVPLLQRSSYQDLRTNPEGYYFDAAKKRLYVQIKGNTDSSYIIKATGILLNTEQFVEVLPDNFKLEQNYPNPFNPSTKISWQSPTACQQTLKVFDILGNEVATLIDEYRPAGKYEVEFNSHSGMPGISDLPSGVYFYRLQAGIFMTSKKMLLIK